MPILYTSQFYCTKFYLSVEVAIDLLVQRELEGAVINSKVEGAALNLWISKREKQIEFQMGKKINNSTDPF